MPFEGLELFLSPSEAKGGRAKFAVDVSNTGNTDADVDLAIEAGAELICLADPDRLQLVNGGEQRVALKDSVTATPMC